MHTHPRSTPKLPSNAPRPESEGPTHTHDRVSPSSFQRPPYESIPVVTDVTPGRRPLPVKRMSPSSIFVHRTLLRETGPTDDVHLMRKEFHEHPHTTRATTPFSPTMVTGYKHHRQTSLWFDTRSLQSPLDPYTCKSLKPGDSSYVRPPSTQEFYHGTTLMNSESSHTLGRTQRRDFVTVTRQRSVEGYYQGPGDTQFPERTQILTSSNVTLTPGNPQ